MYRVKREWTDLKTLIDVKKINPQFIEDEIKYEIWITEELHVYYCLIYKESPAGSDETDFSINYKPTANGRITPIDEFGKSIVRAETRPIGTQAFFTTRGDGDGTLGDGEVMCWDFSNQDNEVDAPSGYRRKKFDLYFIDPVWVKEGTFYWMGAKKGSYFDFKAVCPPGGYYLDNAGNVQAAGSDEVEIAVYVNHHLFMGDCPMGDELNTETTSDKVPVGYFFRLCVTVPSDDSSSYGHGSLEMYRERSVIL